jgi:hypothetical protein
MISKTQAILSLVPSAQIVVRGDIVEWYEPSIAPVTDAEIDAEVARLTALEPARIATENRRAAYIAEADPLFFKAQRGEATMEEWQAKIAEIKNRFPKD